MMGNSPRMLPHRSQPLMISAEFCALFDEESRTRLSSKFPWQGQTKSCRRVNFISDSGSAMEEFFIGYHVVSSGKFSNRV